MTDTTAVNFGIAKLTQAFQSIAPSIQSVSEKYVQYTVMKEVIQLPIIIFVLIASVIGFIF